MSYPLCLHLTEAVPGRAGDNWQFYWDLWWIKRALVELHTNPYFTTEVFYPYGSVLYFHTLHLFPNLLALPVACVLGLTVAYNLTALLAFVLGGYGAYRLLLFVLAGSAASSPDRQLPLAAFAGGTVFTFSAFHLLRLNGQMNLVSCQWLPFFVLYLFRTWRQAGSRNPLLAALLFWIGSLTDWHYTLYLLAFTALFLAYHVPVERDRPDLARAVARIGIVLAICAIAIGPVLVPALWFGRSMGRVPDPHRASLEFSADLMALLGPSPLHPLRIHRMLPALGRLKGFWLGVSLGCVPLVLAIGTARTLWARQRFWVLALGFFGLMSLGPRAHVGGHVVTFLGRSVPTPYALFQHLPYADIFRSPRHFVTMGSLALAVLAAQAGLLLLRRFAVRPIPIFALMMTAILSENVPVPYQLSRVEIPAVYAKLAEDPRRVALFEVPVSEHPLLDAPRMLYQTRHGKPIYGGYLSRGLPPLPLHDLPGFGHFYTLSPEIRDIVPYPRGGLTAIGRVVLNIYGAGYVVIDKTRLDPVEVDRARAVAAALFDGAAPFHEDTVTLTYAVPQGRSSPPFVCLDVGWSPLEKAAAGAGAPQCWRWMGQRARLRLYAPAAGVWRLRIQGWAPEQARRLAVLLDGRSVSTLEMRPVLAIQRTAPMIVGSGVHSLELRSLDGAGAQSGRGGIAVAEIDLEELAPVSAGSAP